MKSIKRVFTWVRQETGITNSVFHDFRHTAVTNLRRAGVDALAAMKIAGHKTMAVFKQYTKIDDDDLTTAQRRLDTYMGTIGRTGKQDTLQVIEKSMEALGCWCGPWTSNPILGRLANPLKDS
jgi:Phage integrase family